MLILQILAVIFIIIAYLGFNKVFSECQSIRLWISHVNDKMTRIEGAVNPKPSIEVGGMNVRQN